MRQSKPCSMPAEPVSRSSSGWEGVVPGCYGRQIEGGRSEAGQKIARQARLQPLAVLTVIGSSRTGN